MRGVCVLLIFISVLAKGQSSDTIFNQTDNQGRKQGFWKVYYESKKPEEPKKVKYIGFFKNNKPVGTFKRFYEDGVIKAVMNYDATGTNVYTTLYYQNGTKAAEGKYVGTLKDSIWNYYSYYDKTLSNKEPYIKGKKEGISVNFYASGKKSQELEYKNDIKDGIWKQYYDSGNLKLLAQFKDGKRVGSFVVYYPNNKVEWKGTYVDDIKHGKWAHNNPDGTFDSEIEYVNGVAKNSLEINSKESKILELLEKKKGTIPEPDENNIMMGPGM
jgi:antitoxin component YwqK of YwqJK toxin-antitoxin module